MLQLWYVRTLRVRDKSCRVGWSTFFCFSFRYSCVIDVSVHITYIHTYIHIGNWNAVAGLTGGRINRFHLLKQSTEHDPEGGGLQYEELFSTILICSIEFTSLNLLYACFSYVPFLFSNCISY